MYKIFSCFTVLIFSILLISCVSILRPPSANATGPRVIILNDKVISEDDVGGFTSWYCRDYVYEDRVLLEFGYFNDPNLSGIGFILYDGGYTGEFTLYQRSGVEHRWDWGPNETDYSFVIKPDGIGLYYDFSYARKGESIKARDVYKCYKR